MESHYKLSDTEFEKRFQTCALEPSDFTHEAHLRLTYIHIDRYGLVQAKENIQKQLKAFVSFAGAESKYDSKLTLAAIHIVHHFIQKATSTNFKDFIAEFPALKYDFKSLIASQF